MFKDKAALRPGLQSRQVAYEPGVDPLIRLAAEQISKTIGFRLNVNNPCHMGIVLEYLSADYLAGLNGCSFQPPLSRFPGNWTS